MLSPKGNEFSIKETRFPIKDTYFLSSLQYPDVEKGRKIPRNQGRVPPFQKTRFYELCEAKTNATRPKVVRAPTKHVPATRVGSGPDRNRVSLKGNMFSPKGNIFFAKGNMFYPTGNMYSPKGNMFSLGETRFPLKETLSPLNETCFPVRETSFP